MNFIQTGTILFVPTNVQVNYAQFLIIDFIYSTGGFKEDKLTKSEDLYVISKEFSHPNYGNANIYGKKDLME